MPLCEWQVEKLTLDCVLPRLQVQAGAKPLKSGSNLLSAQRDALRAATMACG